ncbi:MAG: RNase P modulator RnpM [Bacilli bacterium]
MKPKKIPMRKCVVTNEQHPKSDMFRVVHTTEGPTVVDQTGKIRGRGAYLSKDKEVILMAMKKKVLDRHLETQVPDTVYEQLLKILGE